jgi:hypothetical protein
MLRTLLHSAILGLALLLVASNAALADSAHLTVIPPATAEAQTGRDYGEWSAVWWKTMLALSNSQSPIMDFVGVECHRGERPSVFLLAGAGTTDSVSRRCTVPTDKPIFMPIINVECSNVEVGTVYFGATAADRAKCAAQIVDTASNLVVTLDGVAVPNPGRFRAASPPFSFTMPAAQNFLGVPGVTSGRSASDGYWILLRPPSPGKHVIHVEGAFLSTAASFSQNVTYLLQAVEDD